MKRGIPLLFVALVGLVGVLVNDDAAQVARAQAPDGLFVPIAPQRLIDTRKSRDPFTISSVGSNRDIDLVGNLEIGADTKSSVIGVFVNITVLDATTSGFVTVFPSSRSRPNSSIVNFTPNDISSNGFFIATPSGSVSRFSMVSESGISGQANVILDVAGIVTSDVAVNDAARLVAVLPNRVFDSRRGAVVGPHSLTRVDFTNDEQGVVAVAINITVDNWRKNSLATFIGLVSDEKSVLPETSLINVERRETKSNFSIIPVDETGHAVFFNSEGDTNLIIDQVGYFTTDQSATATSGRIVLLDTPFRVLDSRPSSLGPGQQVTWDFQPFILSLGSSRIGLENSRVFFGNFTAVNVRRRAAGLRVADYITIFPTGTARPDTSNITVGDGQTLANSGLFMVSDTGLDIYNDDGYADYLLDVSAVVTG